MSQMRLDKYLADMGVGTRSQIKEDIKKGKVFVNDMMIKTPELKVLPDSDIIFYDNELISYTKWEYIMLYKPAGVLSATRDKKIPTVLDLLKEKKRKDLFPVGRLDKDTEGLLFITNDGLLAHQILSPKNHVAKCYYVEVNGSLTQEMIEEFQTGLKLEDGYVTLPSELKILKNMETQAQAEVTIYEGKYHQIKRMFEAVGRSVIYLKRLSMGTLVLDPNLEKGEYRYLTKEEIECLKEEGKKKE
ncbi:MAG: rRNA pseudouridine synthase [Lachnospiraceae bacterium]|jgi:16S rRNA pseudouridine516 synthase|nr:rRNA pseudouridine synthase [Lachnospiraceae bacterium]